MTNISYFAYLTFGFSGAAGIRCIIPSFQPLDFAKARKFPTPIGNSGALHP